MDSHTIALHLMSTKKPLPSISSGRMDSLDSLRGLALVMVAAIHCSQSYESTFGISNLLAPYGSLGVQLFFIISGFTMLLTFGGQYSSRIVGTFYIRRIARIAPLFWIAIFGYLWIDGVGSRFWAPNGIHWSEIIPTFIFLNGFIPQAINAIVPGGWSIAVEMQFYCIFPIFAYLFIRRGFNTTMPYLIIVAIYGCGLFASHWYFADAIRPLFQLNEYPLITSYLYFWLPNQILCFGFGFLLYEQIEKNTFNIFGTILLVTSSLVTSLGLAILFLFLISYFVLSNQISINIFRRIGLVSYAMYLMQFAVIQLVSLLWIKNIGHLPSFELGFSAVVLISYVISRFIVAPGIEQPTIAIGKILAAKRTL